MRNALEFRARKQERRRVGFARMRFRRIAATLGLLPNLQETLGVVLNLQLWAV